MAKLNKEKTKTEYDSYEEYVDFQDGRFHDYDCPNCLVKNTDNLSIIKKLNIEFESLLDIGSRDSSWFDKLTKSGKECIGIDISPRSVKYARSKNRNVILGDAANLSKLIDKNVDLILSNHSFEHFLNPEAVLNESYKILNNPGYIFIRLPKQEKLNGKNPYAHVKTYTEEELKDLLKICRFEIIYFEINECNEFIIVAKKQL